MSISGSAASMMRWILSIIRLKNIGVVFRRLKELDILLSMGLSLFGAPYSCRTFDDIRFALRTINTSSMCVGVMETGVMSRNSHTRKYKDEGTAIFKSRLVATASWNMVLSRFVLHSAQT